MDASIEKSEGVYRVITHIVLFAFKDENKEANIAKAKQLLEALPKKIEVLKGMEVGINFSPEDRAMDMSIITTFDTKEGLSCYATHPAHLEVVDFLKQVCEYTKVVDYQNDATL